MNSWVEYSPKIHWPMRHQNNTRCQNIDTYLSDFRQASYGDLTIGSQVSKVTFSDFQLSRPLRHASEC